MFLGLLARISQGLASERGCESEAGFVLLLVEAGTCLRVLQLTAPPLLGEPLQMLRRSLFA